MENVNKSKLGKLSYTHRETENSFEGYIQNSGLIYDPKYNLLFINCLEWIQFIDIIEEKNSPPTSLLIEKKEFALKIINGQNNG